MRFLWYNWRDIRNPAAGGAEVYTHEVARRLVSLGHQVTLFTSIFQGAKREEFIDGIKIIRDGGKYTVYRKAKRYYKRRFSKENYDIVVDEINTIPFFTTKFVKNNEKIVALIHQLAREFWFYETPFPVNLLGYHFLEEWWLRNYHDIPTITVSESSKHDLLELGFSDVSVIHNGLNVKAVDVIPIKAEKPVVVFLGRMIRAKKPHDVLEAFKTVKEVVHDAELWMIGEGYLKNKLENIASPDVKFFGYVDENKRDSLLSQAWVIAIPGVREGWGQIVTDANSLGTPAVGYDIHGLRDSIKNLYNGLLVENNSRALAEGLIKVLTDDKLRHSLSENAKDWARQYDWDKAAEEFVKLLG